MASIQNIFLKAKQVEELQKPNFQKANQLIKRLLKIKSLENLDAASFETSFGYSERLIYQIPTFVLNVLERISDEDLLWAIVTVLVVITHCPICNSDVTPNMENCPNCNATLPKGTIALNGYNWVPISSKTRKLLNKISTNGNTAEYKKNLVPISKKVTEEILNCPDCGMEIMPPNANYCWNCGSKI